MFPSLSYLLLLDILLNDRGDLGKDVAKYFKLFVVCLVFFFK